MPETETAATRGYKTRPPLWQPEAASVSGRTWIAAVLALALGLVVTIGILGEYFTGSALPLEVEVLRLDSSVPTDGPSSYRYWVRLPDGSESRFESARVYRPGDRVVAMASRGRLTGRVWLRSPHGPTVVR